MHTRWARLLVLGLVFGVLLGACQTRSASAPTLFNPLNALDGADPWLQFYDGSYYLTTTQINSIRMWKSPTLAGLAQAKPTTVWYDDTPSRCCNVWAPEFHLLDGPSGKRWYIYYSAGTDGTLDNQHTHVLESAGTDPLGPYTYKAQIADQANNGWAIDGSVLSMPDNKLFFLFSSWVEENQTMFIAPMSDPWTISGERVLLSEPTLDWERSVGNVNEGPEALQHDGKTFIVYSASACWGDDYKLGLLTYNGGDVLDTNSWVKSPQPVFQRSDANSVYAPGHNGFFTSPDGKENWIVYHANSKAGEGCENKRTTRVQKFTWNQDGTPNFGTPVSFDTPVAPPSGEQAVATQPAGVVRYNLVSKNNDQCLAVSGNNAPVQPAACGDTAEQQWSLDYLANGYYRLASRSSGQVLSVVGDASQVQQAAWAHTSKQQWRVAQAEAGWVRLEARDDGTVFDTGGCGTTGASVQAAKDENACQQFRLQPVGSVKLVNFSSNKPIAVNQSGVVVQHATDDPNQRWQFVHTQNGYYQLMVEQDKTCLAIGDADNAPLVQQPCGTDEKQQWRFDALNDGTIRLISPRSGRVADVSRCGAVDGTTVGEWVWQDNECQRFRLEMP